MTNQINETDTQNTCPCGSGKNLEQCCLPIITRKKNALTAEELLRARYSSFVLGNVDFILDTHHSKTRNDVKKEEIEDWSKNSKWLGLEIKQVEGGAAGDKEGKLIFCAHYETKGKKEDHWEQSVFEKENDQWKFLDGQRLQVGPIRREGPKLGRNDPCPCGSGKKFKKCCSKQ